MEQFNNKSLSDVLWADLLATQKFQISMARNEVATEDIEDEIFKEDEEVSDKEAEREWEKDEINSHLHRV